MPAAAIAPLILVLAVLIGGIVLARRGGYLAAGGVVVRCNQGHLFSTVWIPGASFKAIRLGMVRIQRCPVGDHLAFVTPVRYDELTEEERRIADGNRDGPLP